MRDTSIPTETIYYRLPHEQRWPLILAATTDFSTFTEIFTLRKFFSSLHSRGIFEADSAGRTT